MIWYYAKDGKPAGPFEDPEFRKLVSEGAIQPQTMVWNETMTRWERWEIVQTRPIPATEPSPVSPSASSTASTSRLDQAGSPVCDACGKPSQTGEFVVLHGRSVCPECKPGYVQAIQEGAVPPRRSGETENMEAATLLRHSKAHAASPQLSTTLRASLHLLQTEWGTMAGATFLFMVIALLVSSSLEWAVELLPQSPITTILSGLTTAAIAGGITGPISAGLLWMFLKIRRHEDHSISMLGSGFQFPRFGSLIWIGIIDAVLGAIGFLPANLLTPADWANEGMEQNNPRQAALFASMAFGFAFYVINSSFWCLAPLLVFDRGYHWKDALITSASIAWHHKWSIPWIFLLATLASFLGMAALCIGIVFTLPFGLCAVVILYERLFGREIGSDDPS